MCMNTRGYKVKMCAADSKFCRRAENFWMSHNHIYCEFISLLSVEYTEGTDLIE